MKKHKAKKHQRRRHRRCHQRNINDVGQPPPSVDEVGDDSPPPTGVVPQPQQQQPPPNHEPTYICDILEIDDIDLEHAIAREIMAAQRQLDAERQLSSSGSEADSSSTSGGDGDNNSISSVAEAIRGGGPGSESDDDRKMPARPTEDQDDAADTSHQHHNYRSRMMDLVDSNHSSVTERDQTPQPRQLYARARSSRDDDDDDDNSTGHGCRYYPSDHDLARILQAEEEENHRGYQQPPAQPPNPEIINLQSPEIVDLLSSPEATPTKQIPRSLSEEEPPRRQIVGNRSYSVDVPPSFETPPIHRRSSSDQSLIHRFGNMSSPSHPAVMASAPSAASSSSSFLNMDIRGIVGDSAAAPVGDVPAAANNDEASSSSSFLNMDIKGIVGDSAAAPVGDVPAVANNDEAIVIKEVPAAVNEDEDVPVDINVNEGSPVWEVPNSGGMIGRVIRSAGSLASRSRDRVREALHSAGSSVRRRHRHRRRRRLGCQSNDAVVEAMGQQHPGGGSGGGDDSSSDDSSGGSVGGGGGGGPPQQPNPNFENEWSRAGLPMNQQSHFIQTLAQDHPDEIRSLFIGLPAINAINAINTGTPQRNHNLPDGWTSVERARVLFNLSFAPNTRYHPGRRLLDGVDLELTEQSLMAIVNALADVIMANYSDCVSTRDVVVTLILGTVIFSNRMPYDGLPTWHSDSTTRPNFRALARLTDPHQRQVHAHLIRRCPNITRVYHFGRPSFDRLSDQAWYNVDGRFFDQQTSMLWHPCTIAMGWMSGEAREVWIEELNDLAAHLLDVPRRDLDLTSDRFDGLLPRRTTIPRPPFDGGMWINGHGYSVALNPEICAAIAENEDNLDRRTANHYREIYEEAVRNNTTDFLGEWICSNPECRRVHSFQNWGRRCSTDLNQGQEDRIECQGRLSMIRTRDERLVEMTVYGVAPGCPNTDPNRRCIGRLNGRSTCRCGLRPRRLSYTAAYDLSQRIKAPGTIYIQVYRNGEPVPTETGEPLGVIDFCRIIRPWLAEGLQSGRLNLGWFQQNDMLHALRRHRAGNHHIIGDGDGRDLELVSVNNFSSYMSSRHFRTRPRWSIVIEGLEYRTVPWSTKTREELEEAERLEVARRADRRRARRRRRQG